jgi:energy-coupling factor transport system ATP-binding protein
MITAENLRYRTLSLERLRILPSITSVIGPNGSGKTTLLRLLAGIAEPDTGTILIDGVPPRNTEIGWVNEFPDRNILFGNVFEEIASPLRFRHAGCRAIGEQVDACMTTLGISGLRHRSMEELSGGEKVLVALAAALVLRPRVLVLDEYDSHLDGNRAGAIETLLRDSGTPFIIRCTQDMEAALRGDWLIFLEDGKIRAAGTPDEVFRSLEDTSFYPFSRRCRA